MGKLVFNGATRSPFNRRVDDHEKEYVQVRLELEKRLPKEQVDAMHAEIEDAFKKLGVKHE